MTRWARRVLLLLVAVVQIAGPHSGGATASAPAAAVAGSVAVAQVAVLLQLRRRPVVLAGVIALLYAVQVLAVDVVLPVVLWVALWQLPVLVRRRMWAIRATARLTAAALLIEGGGELLRAGSGLGAIAAAGTVAVSLAALLRRSERSRLLAVRAEGAAAERLRIAADLHDLAGHGLGVVAVQSSTARIALEAGDTEAAARALGAVEASSRSALKEMRQLLTVLRGPDEAEAGPLPGLADITRLVDGLTAGRVDVTAGVTTASVPPALQLTAYRIVQEALTNAVKHAPGSSVAVDVRVEGASLLVDVTSTGPVPPQASGGSGLDGIRARVAAAGGTVQTGPAAEGWSVRADLPLVAP